MKRFTDSEKWSDKFFRRLTPIGKLFWIWLCDNCDNAGIWERDDELFKFFSGVDVEVGDLLEELGDRIETLEDGRIILPKFVLFQQGGMLNGDKPPHRQIIRLLEKNGLEQRDCGEIRKGSGRVTEGLAKVIERVTEGKEKAKETISIGLAYPIGSGNSKGKGNIEEESEEEDRPEGWTGKDFEDFRPSWDAFLKHRKENAWGKPKPTHIKTLFARFEEVGKSMSIIALKKSVSSGWKGVFPEKETTTNNTTKFNDDDRDYDNAAKLS